MPGFWSFLASVREEFAFNSTSGFVSEYPQISASGANDIAACRECSRLPALTIIAFNAPPELS
jgi:hypothetical protein